MPSVPFYVKRPAGLSQRQWLALAGQALEVVRDETPVGKTGDLQNSWVEPKITSRSVSTHTNASAPYASYVNNAETPRGREPSEKQLRNKGFVERAERRLSELAGDL
jgi:hypothetical protein